MSILQTSLSALRVSQRALEVTSHNIANVNTPGYSRQRVNLVTRTPTQFGFGAVGNGAQVDSVQRLYDQFLGGEVTRVSSDVGRFEAYAGLAGRLGNLLNDTDAGLSSTMQSFFNAAGDVANDPASLSAREAMLGETRSVVERFNQMATQIDALDTEVNARIAQDVADIDALAQDIAAINDQIAIVGGTRDAPPDLLDRRESLVNELASRVAVTTNEQEDGSLNVFLGNGQLLVRGADVEPITTSPDPLDPTRVLVQIGVSGGQSNITDTLSGGSLGGLLEFARDGLGSARNQLGRIATAFATAVNEQHARGMDFDGELGGEFFRLPTPQTIASQNNTGSADVSLAIGDLGALSEDDFTLGFDGTNFTVTSRASGEPVPFSGSGSAADPLVFAGVEVVVTGTPAAGDQFALEPVGNAARGLELALTSGRDIAAAFPVTTRTGESNVGSGTIDVGAVTDVSNPALLTDSVIQFVDASTYTVNGAGSFAYVPGEPFVVDGVEVTIDGAPAAGDTFTLTANTGGIGDNRNIQSIAQVGADGRLDSGRETLNDAVSGLVSQAGIQGREASRGLAAQQSLLEQAEARVLEVSGVNLDEEAANLLQFQQSYQAATQMIAVADSLFATLLNAVAR